MNSNSTLRPRIRSHLVSYIEREAARLETDDLGMVVNRMLEDHKLYLGSLACVEVSSQITSTVPVPSKTHNQDKSSVLLPVEVLADEYADILNQEI